MVERYKNRFSETIVIYDLKLGTDDRSDKKFLFTSKLFPLPRGCMYKMMKKKCTKSDFKELSLKLAING